jgi:hypothetical protein
LGFSVPIPVLVDNLLMTLAPACRFYISMSPERREQANADLTAFRQSQAHHLIELLISP